MSPGRKRREYIGQRFGLVTATARSGDRQLWVLCDCGVTRRVFISNVMQDPPKGHSKCREFQYELGLDSP